MSNQPPQGPGPDQGAGSGPPSGSQPPAGQPQPGGPSTSVHSVLGVVIGLFLFVLPGLVAGVVFAALDDAFGSGAGPILTALVLAIIVPLGLFLLLDLTLKDGTVQQRALRNAMRIIFFVGAGTYAVGGLIFGVCIALLAGAY